MTHKSLRNTVIYVPKEHIELPTPRLALPNDLLQCYSMSAVRLEPVMRYGNERELLQKAMDGKGVM